MSQIKAIIFDYFGVICSDHYWDTVGADKNVADNDAEFLNLANRVNLGKLHWREFMQAVADKSGLKLDDIEQMYRSENLNPAVLALAQELHKTYKTALLSNASAEFLDPIVHQAHLNEVFDVIVISSKVGFIKPDPRIFEYTLDQLGVKPAETILIDDIERNVQAAQEHGLESILYKDQQSLNRQLARLLNY